MHIFVIIIFFCCSVNNVLKYLLLYPHIMFLFAGMLDANHPELKTEQPPSIGEVIKSNVMVVFYCYLSVFRCLKNSE